MSQVRGGVNASNHIEAFTAHGAHDTLPLGDFCVHMKTNHVRQKLLAWQPTIGSFMGLGSPNVAELMAHAGLEWLVIETEHNGLDSAEVEQMVRAIDGTDTVPLVRVPSSAQVPIQRALDIGAMGIVVPMVKSVEEAEDIVRFTRLPPDGTRSWGPLRASHYGIDTDDYYERANDNIIVGLIIETPDAVQHLEGIGAVPGIDVFILGAWDLSLSLGLDPRKLPHPEVDDVLEKLLEVGRKTGVAVGTNSGTPEGAAKLLAQGISFLSYGTDYSLLVDAVSAGVAAFKRSTS